MRMGAIEDATAQWLAQFKAMRDAIVELKLHEWQPDGPLYGYDFDIPDPPLTHQEVELPKLHTPSQRQQALQRLDDEHKRTTLQESQPKEAQYPHVYKASGAGDNYTLAHSGRKYGLPVGSERIEKELYEEYSVPATQVGTLGKGRKLIEVAEMDTLCRSTFEGYKTLNRMQSLVYPVAYGTNENMLICAPTGAGKTDVAMLAILNTISHYVNPKPSVVGPISYFYTLHLPIRKKLGCLLTLESF